MVKTTAPCFSNDARGSVGGVLTFSKSKHTNTVRYMPKPKQPDTHTQLHFRALTKFLSQQWKLLSPADKLTWSDPASRGRGSAYNAFIGRNLFSWNLGQAPSKTFPRDGPDLPAGFPGLLGTPGVKQANLRPLYAYWASTWAYALHRALSALDLQDPDTVIAFVTPIGFFSDYTDAPLKTGTTYYYRIVPFAPSGDWGDPSGMSIITPL